MNGERTGPGLSAYQKGTQMGISDCVLSDNFMVAFFNWLIPSIWFPRWSKICSRSQHYLNPLTRFERYLLDFEYGYQNQW